MNRLRTIGALGALLIVLAACNGPAASGSDQASNDASSEAPASEPGSSDGGPQPSFSAGLVADLEAIIPRTVAGMTMQIESMQGNDYLLQGDDPATVKFLEDLGVSPSDVSMAFGFAFSADAGDSAGMFVFRAQGAESGRLLSVFKESMDAERDEPLVWTSTTLAGKQVETAVDASANSYVYVKGDILVWFFASSPEIAEELASNLP